MKRGNIMKTKRKKIFYAPLFIFTVLLLDHPAIASHPQVPTEKVRSTDFEHMIKLIEVTRASKDMNKMESLAQEIQTNWSKADTDQYSTLMDDICNVMLFSSMGREKQMFPIVEKYALLALDNRDVLPVLAEADFVSYLLPQENRYLLQKNQTDSNWVRYRKIRASISLHALGRIANQTDPHFDFSKIPIISINPPVGSGLDSGSSPQDVVDPKLRAEYEVNIKNNDAVNDNYRNQIQLKQLNKTLVPQLEKYIVNLYSQKPSSSLELESLTRTYNTDAVTRKKLLDQVAKNMGATK